ncbi:MAG: DUF3127 domain-containing protein [Bacteroidales bacterium]|nr:DUF3127 domain-containing protein [Bacteroidales bacterium]
MASLELEGKIKMKLTPQSGQSARGQWVRQDFVVEYPDGNFTSEACFSAWGQERVDELGKFGVGASVKVSFNVKAREYSGKWYNDLRVWRISAVQTSAPQLGAPQTTAPQAAPLTVGNAAPPPSFSDMPVDLGEDLPF